MEKKKETTSEQLAWILKLPDEGGAWGLGITETVKSIEAEMERLEAQKATIDEQLKARKKLIKATARRAEKEAPLLHSPRLIERAKAVVEPEPEVDVDVDTE
jgi:hypothetical protein